MNRRLVAGDLSKLQEQETLMKLVYVTGYSMLIALVAGIMPSLGECPRADELLTVSAGAYTACMHKGPLDGNCTDCKSKITCDVYQKWSQCITFSDSGQCLACDPVTVGCSGHAWLWADDDCTYGNGENCEPEDQGFCARTFKAANVDSCATSIPNNQWQTCPNGVPTK
jgi:hypothetical protein